MSVEDVADYLGVPKSTVYDQWKTWGLPAYRVGRNLRFRERNVESWLERQAL
ncbi:helix-turn-helix domain-containing protein [Streptosporangium oxazolinicum]